ncbi:hypothetical protein QTO34_016792 [Cnephaeus nilssonii]|uniref:Uncharacterized protein n=1 Tax=Cnephaeus nilssonii TaxID=3371016 RepID=A0AA40I2Z1_CNENI|nr:hypothetical protein QTO34_016792 [Eptesicus nilssonii]
MFSCCLPVSRGRCLKRGSDESVFSRGRRWIRTWTQRKGRLWPFSRRRHSEVTQESSTRANDWMNMILEQPQLLYEYPCPMCLREVLVSHTTLGQRRPEVRVAAWGSGEPGPMGAGRWTPPPEPHRPHQPPTQKPFSPNTRRLLFNSGLPIFGPRPPDLEPMEAEPKGEKVGGGGGMGGAVSVSLWGGIVARHTGNPPEPDQEQRLAQTTRLLDFGREGILWWVLGSSCVLCLGAQGNSGTWVTFSPLTTPAPAQGADAAPPVTSKVHAEELEAPEPVPPPAASPAAAVEPGPAPDTTEAPPALEEEPSPGPSLVPASEEELPRSKVEEEVEEEGEGEGEEEREGEEDRKKKKEERRKKRKRKKKKRKKKKKKPF